MKNCTTKLLNKARPKRADFCYNIDMKKEILTEITKVVQECGNLIREVGRKSLDIKEKTSVRDVVTEYDVATQDRIIKHLSGKFPEAGFISEELATDTFPENELVFVIDPIDGTMNFTKDMGYSCISVACFKDKKPYVGVVYDPYRDEMFAATLGGGAFCNNQPVHVTSQPLSSSLVQTGTSSYYPELRNEIIKRFKTIMPKCIDIRIQGSGALGICQVATGRAGLYFEIKISLWDYAAAALILTEAGGEILNLNGDPIPYAFEKTSIIAGPINNIKESGLTPSL